MSFDQDPNEQADVSGADLAVMIDEIKTLQALVAERDTEIVRLNALRVSAAKNHDAILDMLHDTYQAKLAFRQVRDGDVSDIVTKALRKAWQLGQTYWQQADSESYKENAKSDATQEKFRQLCDETQAAILTDTL